MTEAGDQQGLATKELNLINTEFKTNIIYNGVPVLDRFISPLYTSKKILSHLYSIVVSLSSWGGYSQCCNVVEEPSSINPNESNDFTSITSSILSFMDNMTIIMIFLFLSVNCLAENLTIYNYQPIFSQDVLSNTTWLPLYLSVQNL